MEYDEMFTVLSMCFAPVGQDEWKQLVDGPLWSDFLDAARRGLQDDDALGEPTSPIARVRSRCPLQEFLSAGEVKALFTPPTYDEKRLFAARHFTGGLPESAVPAESLYTTWSNGSLPSPFSKAEGMYQGDSARYMRDLVERMGMRVPPEFSACPDHLALELDLAAVLLRRGCEMPPANSFWSGSRGSPRIACACWSLPTTPGSTSGWSTCSWACGSIWR